MHKASTKSCHCPWSSASLWVWSNVILFFFYPCSTILPQVFLGLPVFLFLSGVQPRVIFSTASFYIWFTWPIHLCRLGLTSSSTGFLLAQLLKSSLDTLFGQEIQRIRLKYQLTDEGSQVIEALRSTQEEADTRMLLHASHAAKDYDSVVVRFFFLLIL